MSQESILQDIRDERQAQDGKWGGPAHDDTHPSDEWCKFIADRLCVVVGPIHPKQKRRIWIEIAALAVAAAESLERREADLLTVS